MKTTIDIPDPLYRKVKIRAIEQKKTLKDVVLHALQRELEPSRADEIEPKSFRERRKLLPSFRKAARAGAFRPPPGARDINRTPKTAMSADQPFFDTSYLVPLYLEAPTSIPTTAISSPPRYSSA